MAAKPTKGKAKSRTTAKPPKKKVKKSTAKCCPAVGLKPLDPPDPAPVDCTPNCDTGVPCIIWKNAAQELVCLPITGAADKYVKCNVNDGVFLSNT